MGTKEKLVERFRVLPKDFTYKELVTLLKYLGYEKMDKGKTSGSREKHFNKNTKSIICFHKPHPGNIIKEYALKDIFETLKETGLI